MSNFVDCDRDQAFLLPPDLRDWIPSDDLAHFVIEAVERVALGASKVNRRGTGSAQYHPRMMLALLIYCYANGIFSSRRIGRATHRDIGVRFIAANLHPDHDTIARFRRENFAAVSESFLQVLLLAKELKLLRVGLVSVDGSKFKANASKHRSVTYERAGGLIVQLEGEIAALLSRAEAADVAGEEDPQALPKEIARREALRDKLDAARRHLEAQAEARAAAEREAWEAKVAALKASGIEVLVSTAAEGRRRTHDFRPAKASPAVKQPKADWLKAMAEKLASEEGRALYTLRRQTVEPVFGVIKAVLDFAGFSLRGLDKVEGEWTLVALAYNCKRLHKLSLAT